MRVTRRGLPAALVLLCALPVPALGAARSSGAFACPPIAAPGYCGDGGAAARAGLGGPTDVAARPDGSYLVADAVNNVVRLVSDGRITTVAGGGSSGRRSGVALRARLRFPAGVAALRRGYLIADTGNHRVLRVTAGGRFTTVAGDGVPGDRGQGGPARRARLHSPMAVAATEQGEVLIADTGNGRVLKVLGDGSVGTPARGADGVGRPRDVAATPGGSVWIGTADGQVIEVGPDGVARPRLSQLDGGAAGVTPSRDGGLVVAFSRARAVVRLGPDGTAQTLAQGEGCAAGIDDAFGHVAFGRLSGLAVTGDGQILLADTGAGRILRIDAGALRADAGAGLRVRPGACDDRADPEYLLATTPPPPKAADSQYRGRPCVQAARARFRAKFRYFKQGGRIVRRPRARRRFAVQLNVNASVRVFLRANRKGSTRWRKPRRGTLARQGSFRLTSPRRGLRRGRYQLRLSAYSRVHDQRLCVKRPLRVRR